jgi:nucleoside 2-deoxyribosyltransferase
MNVYIAGPMTGIPNHNTPAFDEAAAWLRAAGYQAVSPPDITRANPQPGVRRDGTIDDAAYRALVRLDLIALLDCDCVVLLPGWTASRGCKLEIAVAIAIGIPLYPFARFQAGQEGSDPLALATATSVLGPGANTDVRVTP